MKKSGISFLTFLFNKTQTAPKNLSKFCNVISPTEITFKNQN